MDTTKTVTINFNDKKVTCETKNLYILLAFLLITIVLIAGSIYFCFIKYQEKQKPLPCHYTISKLKETGY